MTIEQEQKKLMRQRHNDLEAFLEAHSLKAEEKAIRRITQLSRKSGGHVHICHVSSRSGMSIITKAKKLGFDVTCEVTPHHLLLTSKNQKRHGNIALEVPPLRKPGDTAFLWRSLQKGSVDTIASDHAPHTHQEKNAESIWDVKPGIVGSETTLPLLLTQVNKRRLTLRRLVQLMCENPARIYRLKDRGSLRKGSIADLTVIDLRKERKIDASSFHSKAKFSPFDGWKIKGVPVKTFVNGEMAMESGVVMAKPVAGRIIR
jgi:dihydroorotase